MKIAVTGNGNIGSRLLAMGCDPLSFDITSKDEVYAEIARSKPDVVIHTACISSPERCEAEYERARLVNVRGTAHVLDAMSDLRGDGKVVLLSTDHVFDGKQGFYVEDDEPNPISEYGRTKFAAEGLVELYGSKTIRISRGFDINSKDIRAFGLAIRTGKPIHVPNFIYRSYCHMDYLAEAIFEYATRFEVMPDMLHIGSQSPMSYYEFVRKIGYGWGANLDYILPRSEEDSGFVKRPHKGGFDTTLSQILRLPIYTVEKSIDRLYSE